MARQILATVDMDCDGPTTYFFRVNVPAHLRDGEAMAKAIELEQVIGTIDPSEWFTVDDINAADVYIGQSRSPELRHWGRVNGNFFDRR